MVGEPTKLLISDEEIEQVHANANFGTMPKRRVIEDGVLKSAMGYTMGDTQYQILRQHGLVRSRKHLRSPIPELTRKGQDYLRAMTFKVGYAQLLDFLSPEPSQD